MYILMLDSESLLKVSGTVIMRVIDKKKKKRNSLLLSFHCKPGPGVFMTLV